MVKSDNRLPLGVFVHERIDTGVWEVTMLRRNAPAVECDCFEQEDALRVARALALTHPPIGPMVRAAPEWALSEDCEWRPTL
jgi:hypothetical protein